MSIGERMARIKSDIENSNCQNTTMDDVTHWEDQIYEMQTVMNWLNEECGARSPKTGPDGRSYIEVCNDTPYDFIYIRAQGKTTAAPPPDTPAGDGREDDEKCRGKYTAGANAGCTERTAEHHGNSREHRFVIESETIEKGSSGRLYFDVEIPEGASVDIDGESVEYLLK